jgi:ABC-type multidrug transport system permease subunit
MAEYELILWVVLLLVQAVLLSLGLWRVLAHMIPMLSIPFWRLGAIQTLISALACWSLALGPELGWFGLLLFLSLLQPLLSAVLLPLWLFARRIANCDPLRERI